MPEPTDRQLVEAIMDATANLSLRERERKTGLSHATFDRFGRGHGTPRGWKQLQGKTRQQVIAYLKRVGKLPEGPSPLPLSATERARLLELVEEMAKVLRGGQ